MDIYIAVKPWVELICYGIIGAAIVTCVIDKIKLHIEQKKINN